MGFRIVRATVPDATELYSIGQRAFRDDPLTVAVVDLDGATPEQREEYQSWRIERIEKRLQKAGTYWFKAVDLATGEIAGFTGIYSPEVVFHLQSIDQDKKDQQSQLPNFANESVFQGYDRDLETARHGFVGERKDFWYIMSMAVDPRYQGRGIGGQLLKADIEVASNARQDIYLDAVPGAVKLYQSHGFKALGKITVLDGKQTMTAMLREFRPC